MPSKCSFLTFKARFRKKTIGLLATGLLSIAGPAMAHAQGIYNFYGTATQGGPHDYGTIFKTVTTGSNAATAFAFPVTAPGVNPGGSLTALNGKLYGVASAGGANFSGVLFEYDPATGIYTKKADFDAATTGAYPHGSLVVYNNKLYGTASSGGAYGDGVLFEYDPATGTLSNKADFDDTTNGAFPQGTPVAYNGKLYGTTSDGGANTNGTIYEYDSTTSSLASKADLDYGTTGAYPRCGLIIYNSKLYGTAPSGGANGDGALFEFDPGTSSLTDVADFDYYVTGASPVGGLVAYNGIFYGMTSDGSTNFAGTLYEFDPATATLSNDADFDYSTTGGGALSGLTVYNSKLYGMVNNGGGAYNGTLIEYDPATASLSNLADFNYSTNGASPTGDLIVYNSKLYGLTSSGGLTGNGTLIEYNQATSTLTKDIDFNSYLLGASPYGSFTAYNGKLYGTTSGGGADGVGTLFEYDPATGAYAKKADFFYGISGAYPEGEVISYGGKLWGMTSNGGANSGGTLYAYDLTTGVLSVKADFDYNTTGAYPEGSLVAYNGKLYAMTPSGGAYGYGTLVQYDTTTATLTARADFDYNTNGYGPEGSLIVYSGKLYGLTNGGGANSNGTLIEYDPATSTLTDIADFDYSTGAYPEGNLIEQNGRFYGTTSSGGANGDGAIFEFDPATATLTDLADFDYTVTGYGPGGDLLAYNGKFYGTAVGGGANYDGTLFEYDPATATLSTKTDFNYNTIGAQPHASLSLVPAQPAPGTANSCEAEAAVTGSGTDWIAITDGSDNAVAEINPNGNSLGSVSTDLYAHSGVIREDAAHKLFIDRNVTITPTSQPATPVDVRIYISEAEYQALKNGTNSLSQPSGISSMNDLALFKSSTSCSGTLPSSMSQLTTTVVAWAGGGYVLSTSVTSFSTFFVGAAASVTLPIHLLDIAASNKGGVNEVTWNTAVESGFTTIYLERSTNAKDFYTLAAMEGRGSNSRYSFTDEQPFKGINYYRLWMEDGAGNKASFSKTVSATVKGGEGLQLAAYPNPVSDKLTIEASAGSEVSAELKDVTGAVVKRFVLSNGKTELDVSRLPKGVYMLIYTDGVTTNTLRIVK